MLWISKLGLISNLSVKTWGKEESIPSLVLHQVNPVPPSVSRYLVTFHLLPWGHFGVFWVVGLCWDQKRYGCQGLWVLQGRGLQALVGEWGMPLMWKCFLHHSFVSEWLPLVKVKWYRDGYCRNMGFRERDLIWPLKFWKSWNRPPMLGLLVALFLPLCIFLMRKQAAGKSHSLSSNWGGYYGHSS